MRFLLEEREVTVWRIEFLSCKLLVACSKTPTLYIALGSKLCGILLLKLPALNISFLL
ncbi:MAG: hypothetical protein NDF56_04125 [archaeon GB-1845-036]|nr:hypothetical protein [Candidatus Culexmicrobium thermophilum]